MEPRFQASLGSEDCPLIGRLAAWSAELMHDHNRWGLDGAFLIVIGAYTMLPLQVCVLAISLLLYAPSKAGFRGVLHTYSKYSFRNLA